jgi:putative methionine-R-sulfoxide reductase with GAF domain/HAMP domain-containing protein
VMKMTNAKQNKPRSARNLANILATRIAVLINVILAIFASFSVYYTYTSYRQSLTAQQQLIAQEAGKTVGSFILDKFAGLETAVGLVDPFSVSAETQKSILVSLLGQYPAFRQFVIIDSRGQQLVQVSRASQTLSSQFVSQVQGDALTQTSNDQRYISPVYIDDLTSEPLIAIAIPVKNALGDFQGTLVAEVNLKFMWDLVDQLKVGETGYAYVVDNQGKLIAFGDTSRVLRGENVQQISEVEEFIQNLSGSTDLTPEVANYTGLLGGAVVGTYVPLGTPQWAVVVELPASEANRPVLQLLLINGIAVLAFTLLGGLAGFLLARLIAAPLVALSHSAEEIANGNLAVEASLSGPAEIGQVASAFNVMTSRLRELIGSLEQRVADRTKDLAIVAEVGTATATILETDRLLQEVVDLTKERFNLYHSHIYLLDQAGENLVLASGAGEPGRQMVAEKRSIPLDREQSLVARAARERKGVTVNDVIQAPDFLPNPLLPDTRSELAVPMIVGGKVIGVFDVQSDQVGRFTDSDINIQTTLAAQVATSIQNVRSFEQAKAQADLESLVNAIGQKIQRAATVDDTLQTAIREVGLALGATRVSANLQASRQPALSKENLE